MNTKFSTIKKHLLLVGLIILTLCSVTMLYPTSAFAQCTPPDAPTAGTPQTFCSSAISTVSDLSATVPSGSTLQWYSVLSGGTVLDPTTLLVNGTTYYAESFDPSTGCASLTRTAVLVIFITPPVITADANQTFCDGATVANLSATIFGPGMINWYTVPTGGSALFFAASLSNGTTYYAESSFNGCVSTSRIPVTVTLLTRPTPTFITSVTEPCAGSTGNVYTTEPGKSNYVWSVSGGGTITSGGSSTDNSVTVTWNISGSQTVSVNYTDGSCNASTPTVLNVNVGATPDGGNVSPSVTVCEGTNSTLLTLTGNTGSVVKWQSSTDNWATPVDIANTSTSYTAVNITVTTKFRAVLQIGNCFSNSADATITVDPPTVAGAVASSTSVCTGTNSTVLTLSGHTGTVTRWQYDEGAGWVDIANVTTTYTAVNLTTTTSFRAEVQNGTCPPAFSAPATITVDPPTVAGAVASSTSVCTGTNSTVLTLSGHTGTVTRWQYDEGAGWVDIANVTTTYTAVNLTTTTSFRAEVQNGTCPPAFSAPATITVDPPTVAGAVASSTTVCSGTNSTVLTLSGHTGTVTRWQYDEGAGWVDIANVTTTYTAVNLTTTTSFRAEVQNGTCPPAFSAAATITVDPPTVAGAVASSTSVCTGTNSTVLTLSGHTGTVTRWQYDEGAGWVDIANVTTTYTAVNLTTTTSFRAEVQNGTCPPAFSAPATITVDPPSVGGSVAGTASVCNCTNSTILTLSGYTGSVTKWQSSTDNWVTSADISNTTNSLTVTNLIITTEYRAVVTSGTCSPANSSAATITVNNCNTAPVITSNGGGATGTINIPENTTAVTTVTATDADVPVQTLSYSITGGADQSLFVINSSTGALSFKTAPNYEIPTDAGGNNVYDVQVTVRDNCTVSLTDVQDLAVTVTDANDAPVANPDNVEAKENQKFTGNVLSNDTDEDGNNLTLNTVPVQPPAHGTLVLSSNGDFTYQPVIDYMGNDSFTYQVCDNGSPVLCSTATVSIEVVKDENCEVFVPNSFSPNGDGIHDYFKIRCLYNYDNPIFEVYNRWGNLVYKKDHYGSLDFWGSEPDAFWNGKADQGTIGTSDLTVGTYYYILKLNSSKVLTGFIFLNR
jgi:gliding motility-associated-like protein